MKDVQNLVVWLDALLVEELLHVLNHVFVPLFLLELIHQNVKYHAYNADQDNQEQGWCEYALVDKWAEFALINIDGGCRDNNYIR